MIKVSSGYSPPPSPNLEEMVPENHPVRVVSATVDQKELKALFASYTKGGGNVKHCTSLYTFNGEFWLYQNIASV